MGTNLFGSPCTTLVRIDGRGPHYDECGRFLNTKITEVFNFSKEVLKKNIFPWGDYKKLTELTLMYLSEEYSFNFKAPSAEWISDSKLSFSLMLLKQ